LGLSILTLSSFDSNLQSKAQADLNSKSNPANSTTTNSTTTNPKSCPENQFLAEYFNGINLEGGVIVSECQAKIDINNQKTGYINVNGISLENNW